MFETIVCVVIWTLTGFAFGYFTCELNNASWKSKSKVSEAVLKKETVYWRARAEQSETELKYANEQLVEYALKYGHLTSREYDCEEDDNLIACEYEDGQDVCDYEDKQIDCDDDETEVE